MTGKNWFRNREGEGWDKLSIYKVEPKTTESLNKSSNDDWMGSRIGE